MTDTELINRLETGKTHHNAILSLLKELEGQGWAIQFPQDYRGGTYWAVARKGLHALEWHSYTQGGRLFELYHMGTRAWWKSVRSQQGAKA